MFLKYLLIPVMFFIFLTPLRSQNPRKKIYAGFQNGYISGSYNYYPSFVDKVNNEIEKFGLEKFDSYVFMYGGELCGNVNPVFGLGVNYYTGGATTQKIIEISNGTDTIKLDRMVKYNISFFGLVASYRKSLLGQIEFFGTLNAGYGNIEFSVSQDDGDQSYQYLWDSFDPEREGLDTYARSVFYNPGLWVFKVDNGLRFFLSSRIAFGATIGYTYGFVEDRGEFNYGFETLKNVPDLDFKGMNFGIALYFGY